MNTIINHLPLKAPRDSVRVGSIIQINDELLLLARVIRDGKWVGYLFDLKDGNLWKAVGIPTTESTTNVVYADLVEHLQGQEFEVFTDAQIEISLKT